MMKLIVAFLNFANAHKNCNVLNTILNIKASFLGGLSKLRISTISLVLSVRMEQFSFNWTDFYEI